MIESLIIVHARKRFKTSFYADWSKKKKAGKSTFKISRVQIPSRSKGFFKNLIFDNCLILGSQVSKYCIFRDVL